MHIFDFFYVLGMVKDLSHGIYSLNCSKPGSKQCKIIWIHLARDESCSYSYAIKTLKQQSAESGIVRGEDSSCNNNIVTNLKVQ